MKNSYTIKELIGLFLNKIWIIIIVTIAGGILSFGFSKMFLPFEYSSHVSMYVKSYTGISDQMADQNNISNSKQLVNTYMEVLKDDAVMAAIGELLLEQFDEVILSENFTFNMSGEIETESLRKCIELSTVTDTSAVKVIATAKNPEIAASICNNLTSIAPEYVAKAVGVGSINTIDKAKVYETPVAPNVIKNTLLGMAAALLIVVTIILITDYFDNTVKDVALLEKKYKKAIIGEIQEFAAERNDKSSKDNYSKLTDKDIPFYIVERYKSIRTNVNFSLATSDKKIFAVSSANPSEGKSIISANIAIALAQGGNKALLIDADMRKAVQHKIFEIKNKKGLSTAISKMNKLDECIQKNVMENLDVMTSGPLPPNPSELLASENMLAILDELNKKYQIIIIDTPPVNVVTDAMELAKCVSGIVVVLRYGRTTTEDIEAVVKKMDFSKVNMLGFILNGIKNKRSGRYYSKYKYDYKRGYGYYGEKTDTNETKNEKK